MSPSPRLRLFSVGAFALALAVAAPLTAGAATHHGTSAALPGYKTAAEAKTGCAGDSVVWRARGSKVFHTASSKYFGKTKHGAFVCEKAAVAKGLHVAKS